MRATIDHHTDTEALFQESWKREDAGDFHGAFQCLLRAANAGHVSSQLNLGNYYSNGIHVPKDLHEAALWYKRVFRSGDPSGAVSLALDRQAQGDRRGAIAWFQRAVSLGDGAACIHLAKMLLERRGERTAALELLWKAAVMPDPTRISQDEKEQAQQLLNTMVRGHPRTRLSSC